MQFEPRVKDFWYTEILTKIHSRCWVSDLQNIYSFSVFWNNEHKLEMVYNVNVCEQLTTWCLIDDGFVYQSRHICQIVALND